MTQRTVLIIDDDPNNIRLLKIILERGGLKVLTAVNGNEGIQTFRQERPNVTFVDQSLPGLKGHEIIIQLRQDFPDEEIYILSAYRPDQLSEVVTKCGATGFITKPVDIDAFTAIAQGASVN